MAAEGKTAAELIGGRYRIERPLGQGGMASVFEVVDTSTGQRRALKRLTSTDDANKLQRATELFEREFHMLAQLAHPRVVSAFDYGLEAQVPYYTMELLDGGDLQQLAPIEWRTACKLARDICSALSVLHSRRMVYRDLSPRNVRCTSDGKAKLIDFGAMAPMGPCKQVVGTASFCAPELVHLQALDARTDLFSLGATLYFTLLGRRPYPARDFQQLRDVWRSQPRRPSELVPGIPPALDRLVMDLIQLDPSLRPASAFEVMERLSAIADLPPDEHVQISQAYLTTPTLVGRDKELARLRRKVLRGLRGRGGCIMIEGAAGAGRSRLLDACVLEAKLAGATVLRADASDAQHGDYGVIRALAVQLLEALPELATEAVLPRLPVLGHIVPELRGRFPNVALEVYADLAQARPALQAALKDWLWEVSARRALTFAIDDVHRIDEPSAACLALLGYEASTHALLIATTKESSAPATAAVKLLRETSAQMGLEPLSFEHTERLLRSVFGDVPNVQIVAHHVHSLAQGNPANVMRLSQYLVDKRVVRYESGAFSLPQHIDGKVLASSMAQALRARIVALSAGARELASAMSLCPEQRLPFEACLLLTAHRSPAQLLRELDELVMADVLRIGGERYELGQQGWVSALHAELGEDARPALHRRVAEMFEARGGERFRVAQQLLRAGDEQRGLDVFVQHAEHSQKETDKSPDAFTAQVQSLPVDWYAAYEAGLHLCERTGRARRERYALLSRLAGFVAVQGITDLTHPLSLIRQLERDSGLVLYNSLDPQLDAGERLKITFEELTKRYSEASEHERVLEPIAAIRQLARACIQITAVIAAGHNHDFLAKLPSLRPFMMLSPALLVVQLLIDGLGLRLGGRIEQALGVYAQLLERMNQPDRAGLDESHHRYAMFGVASGVGMLEATMGLTSALDRAAQIEVDPFSRVNAQLIRVLYHLWQGEADKAERIKREIELVRMQNAPRQWFEGTHLVGELTAHAAVGDLTRVKHTLDDIAPMAERWYGWVPIHHYARGEYHRIRGDLQSALRHFDIALNLTGPGRHQIWPDAAGAKLKALNEHGRFAEAQTEGDALLEAAQQAGLDFGCNLIRLPLALAHARVGNHELGKTHADAVLAEFARLNVTGVHLGLAYETRARVASAAQDAESFELHASKCAALFGSSANRALVGRYASLIREAKQASVELSEDIPDPEELAVSKTQSELHSQITNMLKTCATPHARAQRMLELFVKQSGVSQGVLYSITGQTPVIAASLGMSEPPPRVDLLAREYLFGEIHEQDVTKSAEELQDSSAEGASDWVGDRGERYRAVLMSHATDDGFAIAGMALLVIEPGMTFIYPSRLAADLSRFAFDSGDVSVLIAPG